MALQVWKDQKFESNQSGLSTFLGVFLADFQMQGTFHIIFFFILDVFDHDDDQWT